MTDSQPSKTSTGVAAVPPAADRDVAVSASRGPWRWPGFVAVGLAAAAFATWQVAGRSGAASARALPVLFDAPDFTLVERSGKRIARSDLLGRVWVADFIFTSCAGPCPIMTGRMADLQDALQRRGMDVMLVSFSLDPLRDTPDVLATYARRHGANADRWWFLTGDDEASVHTMVAKGFRLSVDRARDAGPIIHSTHFVLVDRLGRIRAYHEGIADEFLHVMLRDIETLLREQPPRS